MRDMLEARKHGDFAFRDKDFKTAIDCYSQVCFIFVLCFKCSALWLAPGNMPLYIFRTNRQYAWSLRQWSLKCVHNG